ncbi:hypothetical protein T12_8284 [Trichinella patagoniensis]|uniref:Uncharacterized protein n=1 Tax=Trichinella patagoniensis TaxID=990121 RepID=A0A0V0YV45_9BILA|nr:hypothetical protein T12_8284 [Trichinella patagoniensis]
MDRGSNESGRVWNILWQRESTLSPFTYQKVLCRRRTLTKTFDETSSIIWTVAVHMEDNDMIDVYVFADASEKA